MYSILKRFSYPEFGMLLRGNRHGFAGVRIAALTFCALGHREGAETDERDVFSLLERTGNFSEDRIHGLLSLGLAEVGMPGDQFNENVLMLERDLR